MLLNRWHTHAKWKIILFVVSFVLAVRQQQCFPHATLDVMFVRNMIVSAWWRPGNNQNKIKMKRYTRNNGTVVRKIESERMGERERVGGREKIMKIGTNRKTP